MMRPIRRKYRRGLPVLVHRRTGPFARHRVLHWRPSIYPRRCEVAAKARIWGPKIGSIRPSRLARLGTRALRCRERRCYRAMVPIPPNGPSPPPFPFALRRRRFFFSALQHLLDSLVLPHRLAAVYPTATFNLLLLLLLLRLCLLDFSPSCLPSYGPFSFVHLFRTTGTSTKCRRSRATNPSVLRFLCGEHNLPLDLTFLWHFHHGQTIMIFSRWRSFLCNVFFLLVISLKVCELRGRSVKQ